MADIDYEVLNRKIRSLEAQVDIYKQMAAELRAIFNASSLVIVLLDIDGNILDANEKLAARFNTTRDAMMGQCLWDYVPQTLTKHRQALLASVFETGNPASGEDEREGIWSEYHLYPAVWRKDGSVRGVIAEARDITDRKNRLAALMESESRYRSLYNNNHSVMLLVDPENGQIADANSAAVKYYGWDSDTLIKKNISEINTLSKEEIAREMSRAEQASRKSFIFQHRLAGGEVRDVEVYSGPITIFGKKLLYSIIHDITERKKIEAEKKELIDNLEKAVREIKTLQGIVPICSFCKKIRDDKGYWEQVDVYVQKQTHADFSHGICPDCARKYYPSIEI